MPYQGNTPNALASQVAQRTQQLTVVNGANDTTKALRTVGCVNASMVVTQTAGAPGSFRLVVRNRSVDQNYPIVPIPALNIPVVVDFPIGARQAVVQVFGPGAGGPHTYAISLSATGT